VIGSIIGMVAGYLLGMSRTAEVVLSPYILGLQIALTMVGIAVYLAVIFAERRILRWIPRQLAY
jgi:hydrogenase/urease accessory protein HupE